MKKQLVVLIFLVLLLGIFTSAYANEADSPKIRVLNVRTNYFGTIYVNGISTGTNLNFSSANFAQAGTYTIVCSNPRIIFTPSEFYWDASSTNSLYFEGTANPNPATNPNPADGAVITLPEGSSTTNVTLGWQSSVFNGGYKVYWNGAVDPILKPDYNISNNHTWTTTALEAGTYTWKIVPYANDPADPNGGPVKDDSNPAKGDCTEAVEWSFTIEAVEEWDYPADIATPMKVNPNLIITPSIDINDLGLGDAVIDYIFNTLELDEENPPDFLMGTMLESAVPVIADFSVALNQPGSLYAVYLNNDLSWSRATPYMITVLETDPIVPQSWLFEDVNFFSIGKDRAINLIVISSADILPEPSDYDFPEGAAPAVIGDPADGTTINFASGNADNSGIPADPTDPLNAAFVPEFVQSLTLRGAGPWTFEITTDLDWIWVVGHEPYAGHRTITINHTAAKDETIEIQGGNGGNPTLPVELSIFKAMLTAQNYVKLSWVSESETNMLGYRVYRSENAEQASATMITPILIEATNTSSTANYSLEDREVTGGNTYYYWLEAVEYGSSQFFGPQSVVVNSDVTPELPTQSAMQNAYPNPFKANGNTNIAVSIKAGESGNVAIYNVTGQLVQSFQVSEGNHNLVWNGRDSNNNACGSGIYFYKMSTPTMNQTRKLVIIK